MYASHCRHVLSCIFLVLSCDVTTLHSFSPHAALHSAWGKACPQAIGFTRAAVACLREGHWPPENKTSPRWRGGSGALAFPPSVAWSYGPPHRPNGTQPGACCHPTFLNCLEKMLGTVSWYMLPTKSSTSHLASTKVLHGHSPFHAPNRRGCPSGLKHQEGLVFPSSPQGVSKGFPSSPRDKG